MSVLRNLCLLTGGILLLTLFFGQVQSYNDDVALLKWNPNWFSNYRYSAPIGIRGYTNGLYKRFRDDKPTYKWSPVYLGNRAWKRSQPFDYPVGQFEGSNEAEDAY